MKLPQIFTDYTDNEFVLDALHTLILILNANIFIVGYYLRILFHLKCTQDGRNRYDIFSYPMLI